MRYINFDSTEIFYDDNRVSFDGLLIEPGSVKRRRKVRYISLALTYPIRGSKLYRYVKNYSTIGKILSVLDVSIETVAKKSFEIDKVFDCIAKLKKDLSSFYNIEAKKKISLVNTSHVLGKKIFSFSYYKKLIGDVQPIIEYYYLLVGRCKSPFINKVDIRAKKDISNIFTALDLFGEE